MAVINLIYCVFRSYEYRNAFSPSNTHSNPDTYHAGKLVHLDREVQWRDSAGQDRGRAPGQKQGQAAAQGVGVAEGPRRRYRFATSPEQPRAISNSNAKQGYAPDWGEYKSSREQPPLHCHRSLDEGESSAGEGVEVNEMVIFSPRARHSKKAPCL